VVLQRARCGHRLQQRTDRRDRQRPRLAARARAAHGTTGQEPLAHRQDRRSRQRGGSGGPWVRPRARNPAPWSDRDHPTTTALAFLRPLTCVLSGRTIQTGTGQERTTDWVRTKTWQPQNVRPVPCQCRLQRSTCLRTVADHDPAGYRDPSRRGSIELRRHSLHYFRASGWSAGSVDSRECEIHRRHMSEAKLTLPQRTCSLLASRKAAESRLRRAAVRVTVTCTSATSSARRRAVSRA
jgi:hypothetical protein